MLYVHKYMFDMERVRENSEPLIWPDKDDKVPCEAVRFFFAREYRRKKKVLAFPL